MVTPDSLIGKPLLDPDVQATVGTEAIPLIDHFAALTILEYPARGLVLYVDARSRIATIFLYGPKYGAGQQYNGCLPRDLVFTLSREEVAARLGQPQVTGYASLGGPPWDRYDSANVCLHIEYSPDARSIALMTLMSPDMASKAP